MIDWRRFWGLHLEARALPPLSIVGSVRAHRGFVEEMNRLRSHAAAGYREDGRVEWKRLYDVISRELRGVDLGFDHAAGGSTP